ncbi:carbohydrate ABC transporter permease [Periweissella fabalis]|uniref:Carbohydrate ABC transporter permease n=1 Tax=Periweissella fabalis TaxID=1070421 RepID=A0A7X6S480_9LACO|nr:carbohydrate ABC transporter permease [Periweissella fabalis]MCM0598169.1 carbohydrate ABC transporter permease [Periweissella fabalis]NKZ24707.1 carbohydrate ABC transporter permease [Periweissella fabalis]
MNKRNLTKGLSYLILFLGALIMLIPFLWMVDTALKTAPETVQTPPTWFPKHWQFNNFVLAFKAAPFITYFINSIIVTFLTTLGQLVTTILAAFAFAKLNFFGKRPLFLICIGTMMIPGEILIIPNFVTLSHLHLINTYGALILPWLASVFSVFTLRQTFMSISDELYYAAKIDGSSDWNFLWNIMVPLSKSSIIAIVILQIIGSWNSFMWPLIVTNTDNLRTLPVGLSTFTSDAGTEFQLLMAASTIIIVPIIIVYILLQKHIIEGVSKAGLKA